MTADPSGSAQYPVQCNALFCILDRHDGDRHTDVTGHTWTEPTPENEVIARAYSWDDKA